MSKIAVVSVISQMKPLDGQKNRSSVNFSTNSIPTGTKYLSFEVSGTTNNDAVFFNVMEDKTAASDPTIYSGVSNGYRSNNVKKYGNLYIANPEGASNEFEVIVYANL
jgi:hypothetical protein